jgi:hypothetical protein
MNMVPRGGAPQASAISNINWLTTTKSQTERKRLSGLVANRGIEARVAQSRPDSGGFYYLDLLTKDDRRILSWSSDNTLRLCEPWR